MDSDAIVNDFDVEISDTQGFLQVDPDALVHLVHQVLVEEKIERASISLALVDNATIHSVNRRHLEHDWPTDVITFPMSDPEDSLLTGELVVSVEMAVDMAQRAGVAAWPELALYVVHGLLHLCGYDDHSVEDRETIRMRENAILTSVGLTNTFSLLGLAETDTPGRESTRWPL